MATLATLTFAAVSGVITPQDSALVEEVENPALVPAAIVLSGVPQPAMLHFQGWFAESVKAVVYALPGTVVSASDETGATETVLVKRVQLTERAAMLDGTVGVWAEVNADVLEWSA